VPARLAQSLAEHKAILAAIVAGDFRHAAALLIEHERLAASMLIAALTAPKDE
jgi:DNA-binding GntR family transcriptional regulator